MSTSSKPHLNRNILSDTNCEKSVRIRSYFGPYSVRMRENTDQNNSEYGHFLRGAIVDLFQRLLSFELKVPKVLICTIQSASKLGRII